MSPTTPTLSESEPPADPDEQLVTIRWNPVQGEFLQCTARFIDFEGALRSGKSKALVWFFINLCLNFPGIKVLLARFTEDSLNAQLKPLFYDECPSDVLGKWNADKEYQEFTNGSLCYIRALKPGDDKRRFSKTAGLTIAAIGVDQAEELPEDIAKNLIGRISQPGFPQHLVFTPNPPGNDHWLSQMFPENPHDQKADHVYLWTTVYDNIENLGAAYVKSLEDQWPPGHVLHRRNILGRRGLTIAGTPVYSGTNQRKQRVGIFHRHIHANRTLERIPSLPLIEAWDFGHKHPAVTWLQFPAWGQMLILGEIMGDHVYLEDFIPQVQIQREQWFGPAEDLDIWSCCDPAGADQQSSGRRGTALEALNDAQIFPNYVKDSNHPRKRSRSIQRIASFLLRITANGPAFQINDLRAPITADALEGGYVYPEKRRALQQAPNLLMPLKDDYFEHVMNTIEYAVLNYGLDVTLDASGDVGSAAAAQHPDHADRMRRSASTRERARLMRQAGLDIDEDDPAQYGSKVPSLARRSRAGY